MRVRMAPIVAAALAAAVGAEGRAAADDDRRIGVVVAAPELDVHRRAVVRATAETELRGLGYRVPRRDGGDAVSSRELGACLDEGADCVRGLLAGRELDLVLFFAVRPDPQGGEENGPAAELTLLARLVDAGSGEVALTDQRLCQGCAGADELTALIEQMTHDLAGVGAADLEPTGAAEAPPTADREAAPGGEPDRPFRVLKWVTAGVGLGATAGGIGLMLADESEQGGRETRGGGIALTAVGALLVVGGVMMWVHDDRARDRVWVGAAPRSGGALVGLGGRF